MDKKLSIVKIMRNIKIGFLFMSRCEINNSDIWENYFKTPFFDYKISVYTDIGYELKNKFFLKFQVHHNISKNREMNVMVKYDFLEKNIDTCDYYVFLTEDSLPVRKPIDLSNKLREIDYRSIFIYDKDPHVNIDDGRIRYGGIRNYNFPDEFRYKNDDWICISNSHAKVIVNSKNDCVSFDCELGGEHFVSSILNKQNLLNDVICEKFVLENWDGYGNNYPSIFTKNDSLKINSIIEENRYAFFIRKFNNDNELYKLIQKYIE